MNLGKNHTTEDLLLSEEFHEAMLDSRLRAAEFKEVYLERFPQNENIYQEAREAVLKLSLQLADDELSHEHQRFRAALKGQQPAKVRTLSRTRKPWAAAAAVIALMGACMWFLFQNQNEAETAWTKYETAYAQTMRQRLPDGSSVMLNANSALEVPADWEEDNRMVKLSGEAFFEVSHGANDEKFTVRTVKGDITVLGTKFNVQEREGELEVALTEGKVSLTVPGSPVTYLSPGQIASVNTENFVDLKTVDLAPYTAWSEHKMVFKDMPVSRVVRRLKHDFGLDIIVKNERIAQREITASLANDDPRLLLDALAAIYDLKITERDSTTLIIE